MHFSSDTLFQPSAPSIDSENGIIRVHTEVLNNRVRISVSDNGCGISEENLQHIFSPYFTTRRKLGGMGLGLFIAQKVAQSHGGSMSVESAIDKGSTFTLLLPRVAAAATQGTT